MSLIELAIQRAKAAGKSVPGSSATKTGDAVKPSATVASPRKDSVPSGEPGEPVVAITEAFLREKGLSAPATQEHQQRAEYRHIKYGLLQEIRRSGGSGLVLVTSALQGEGKSFSSMHLAMSIASERDYEVVLVDADVTRPSLSRMFDLTERPGLMDAVADPATNVESLILPTSLSGLSFLPAGRPDEHATEHFASDRMREVMNQILAVPHRIAVVDTLPLLLTTEARALTAIGGQIVLVVRADSTPQNAVMQAIDLLGEGANVKLVLNAAVRSKALGYFGFGYGYDYRSSEDQST
jgi:Mrp family chromosome partitioning ATPase